MLEEKYKDWVVS